MRSPRPTVKMRIGHLLELNQPRELAPSVALRQLRNQASAAVRAGFDGVWCGEHHAIGDHSFHPLQVLSIVASDNPSMTVGTSAILMPLHTVGEVGTALGTLAALAEEVILGLGLGYRPSELALFEQRLPGGRARTFEKRLTQLRAFVRNGFLTDEDAQAFGSWAHSPRPSPTMPILLAGLSDAAIDRAARCCDGFLLSPFETMDDAAAKVARFRELWQEHRREGTPIVAVRRDLVIADTDEEAWTLARTYFGSTIRHYEKWGHGLDVGDPDEYLSTRIVFGGADRICEQLDDIRERLVPDWLILRFQGYGMPSPVVLEQLVQFQRVLSTLRQGERSTDV